MNKGIRFSIWSSSLHRLAELISWNRFLRSLKFNNSGSVFRVFEGTAHECGIVYCIFIILLHLQTIISIYSHFHTLYSMYDEFLDIRQGKNVPVPIKITVFYQFFSSSDIWLTKKDKLDSFCTFNQQVPAIFQEKCQNCRN